jgi:hypothetical protein
MAGLALRRPRSRGEAPLQTSEASSNLNLERNFYHLSTFQSYIYPDVNLWIEDATLGLETHIAQWT